MAQSVPAVVWNALSCIESGARRLSAGDLRTRLIVCALALILLYIRIPSSFLAPQLWAEDGMLISSAYNHGWGSIFAPLSGAYYNLYGNIVSIAAVQFRPVAWPWIAIYGAHAAAIMVVFLVSSPRFEIPYRAIAALAVIAAPMFDIFGGLANAQWVFGIAVFVLPLLRPGPSWMLAVEGLFAVILGLEGPFAAFVLPVYAWRIWTCEARERPRLILLAAVAFCTAVIQSMLIVAADPFNLIEPAPYDQIVWLTMPIRWLDSARVAWSFVHYSWAMAAIATVGATATVWFSLREPYRLCKVSMLLFATLILYFGMYKYRAHIEYFSNDRYVYAGAVFAFWFGCIAAAPVRSQRAVIIAPILFALVLINPVRRHNLFTPKASAEWADQVQLIGNGPVTIPIAPYGWVVRLTH